MARVAFTPILERHVDCRRVEVPGATVREALDCVFAENPRLRGYILDDQGELRKHVQVFVDGELVRDRRELSDELTETAEVFVMQALSGGVG